MFNLYCANGSLNVATVEIIIMFVIFVAMTISCGFAAWQIKRIKHERHRLYDAIRRYNQATGDDYDYFKMW